MSIKINEKNTIQMCYVTEYWEMINHKKNRKCISFQGYERSFPIKIIFNQSKTY